ncbi:MAG: lipoate--protein ligase family protein [Chlamydiota bacterium]|jgi:lipoate-protein ligase A
MKLNYLYLENTFIHDQLLIEEKLLRSDNQNWCIVNKGSKKAIVMGVSSNPNQWLEMDKVTKDKIPVIKRFSGGGTVFVDENTLFVTFIFEKSSHDFEPFPEPIHKWAENFYKKVFPFETFSLRENDYVIGERKCGGNAQYIRKNRWLHHTTFLWKYNPVNMGYLSHPPRSPKYRKNRSHSDFLCTLSEHIPSQANIVQNIENTLSKSFSINREFDLSVIDENHRKSVQLLKF